MGFITNLQARAIKPGEKAIPHGGVPGLRLLPTKSDGRGKWELRYTSPITGKRRDAGLGVYPDVSIAAAKVKAEEFRQLVAAGVDPLEVKRQEKHTPKVMTFEQAAMLRYTESLPIWSAGHAQKWLNVMKHHVFPHIGGIPLDAITPANIVETLRPIWIDKHPTAKRVSQRISDIMMWAWGLGMVKANPVQAVLRGMPKHSHKPVHHPSMPWRDIPAFIANHLHGGNEGDPKRLAIEFVILTGGRSGEIRGARWSEIDFETATWTIPPERMKAADWHQVPLSDRALEILRTLRRGRSDVIFASTKGGVELACSTLSAFMASAKVASDIPSRCAVVHGFRASFRNWCSETGHRRDLSERALSHAVRDQVEAAYHRTNLLEERRPMMQQWADFVTGNHGNVIPMRAGSK